MKSRTQNQLKKSAAKAAKTKAKAAAKDFAGQVRIALKATRKNGTEKVAVSKNGGAQTAAPMVGQAGIRATAGDPARYNAPGLYYGQARYVTDDPTPVPTPGSAKVALVLAKRNDADLIGFGHSHDEAIDLNPKFPVPQPSVAEFDAALAAFEAKVTEIDNAHIAALALTEERNALRKTFEQIFTQRGTYVELASQGDSTWIQSAGLPVKTNPTTSGVLPPPLNLRLDLTNLGGQLQVRWNPVTGAKGGYLLEMAEVVDNVAVGWTRIYMGGKSQFLKTDLVSGKTYAFRVAAVGGEGGISAFSPDVSRMVA